MSTTNHNKVVFRLLKRVAIFGVFMLVLFSGFYLINKQLHNKYTYKVPEGTHRILCGPSILKTAVDPAIIPGSVNIAQNEELYPMSAIKLRSILKDNPEVKQVIMALSPGLIANKMEVLAFNNPLFCKEIINRLYPISSMEDFKGWPLEDKIVKQVFFQRLALPDKRYYTNALNGLFNRDTKQKYPYIGNFKSKDVSKLKASEARIVRRLTPRDSMERQGSTFLLQGIEDIKATCAKHDVELIFFAPPLHKSIRAIIPPETTLAYKNVKDQLARENYLVYDIVEETVPDDYYFNASHINLKGSQYVSNKLKLWLEENGKL